jgi:hypothetical protein
VDHQRNGRDDGVLKRPPHWFKPLPRLFRPAAQRIIRPGGIVRPAVARPGELVAPRCPRCRRPRRPVGRRSRCRTLPFWRGGVPPLSMADGDLQLTDDGEILDDDGNLLLAGADGCCCNPSLYRRYKSCATNAYINLWELAVDPVASPSYYPKYIYYFTDAACYYIDSTFETTSSPSRTLGAEFTDHFTKDDCDPCTPTDCVSCSTTPYAILVTLNGLSGGCCGTTIPGFPDFSQGADFSIDGSIGVPCIPQDGGDSCFWFGERQGVGTMTGYGPEDGAEFCAGTPTVSSLNMSVVANRVDATTWSVLAMLYVDGTSGTGNGETGYAFMGTCTVASGDCFASCSASNTVGALCDDNNPPTNGFARTNWASGGTATVDA